MKLSEALKTAAQPADPDAKPLTLGLACSFTPLHLQTYLVAWTRRRHPARAVDVRTGHYGDLQGTVERLTGAGLDAAAVVIEWADLDPRLGLRQLSGWRPGDLADILQTVRSRARRLVDGVLRMSEGMPVALSLPTLPLPPLAYTPGWQAGVWTLELRHEISLLGMALGAAARVRLVDAQRLDELSPPGVRFDVRTECASGFPYRLEHADTLASQLSLLLEPPPPKKGLITDLDDTFWSGIVGDDGIDAVSWSLEGKSLPHGLYQQMLNSLAEAGVLVAVASKNDPKVVEMAFERSDLVCPKERLFPVEAHWGAKSESVARILKAWNISADSVVFVDDSPLELAEVNAAFPDLLCVPFPRQDDQSIYSLLGRLRDLFGKALLSEEDALRQQSLRQRVMHAEASAGAGTPDDFLRQAQAEIEVRWGAAPADPRALELVNKTNQFNLNGRRFSEGEWLAQLRQPGCEMMVASYKDKFGPLGKIAVLMGVRHGRSFHVQSWVLSCRAFARRVEHQCLAQVFSRFDVDTISFAFEATPRNGPLQELLGVLFPGGPQGDALLTREQFSQACPELFHKLTEASDE